jgi:sugar-specific transcriptional regulator TrmB
MATTISEKALKSYLVDFGLNDKEISIYISLLQAGPSTIMDLSRKTSIKRSTTHNNVEELIKKGLVSQTNYGERRMVIAEDPEKLKFLLEQRKWDVQKLEKVMPELVSTIYEMVPQAKTNSQVDVKYYAGTTGVRMVYAEALKSNELKSYVNLAKVLEKLPDNSDLFIDALKKNKGLKIYEILDNSEVTQEYTPEFSKFKNYEYKYTSKSLELSAVDILMYDNKVAVVNVDEGLSAIVIEDPAYYSNSTAIFNFIWGIL